MSAVHRDSARVLVIGHGLAGLVAATESCEAGATVILIDQQGEQDLGGQAYWSFGGLFMVDSPEQRRMGIKDSPELAWRDWLGSAQFEDHDVWPRRWAERYVEFAAGPKREWLRQLGHRLFPLVGWAERGDGTPDGHGNSVPRFHITWGTGPGIVAPFLAKAKAFISAGRLRVHFRHRVNTLLVSGGTVTGAAGAVLAQADNERGAPSVDTPVGTFEIRADATVVASGGIGANLERVRQLWPADLGTAPESMIAGVPAYVTGQMLEIAAQQAGADILNPTRMWHYVEGIRNWDPVWNDHGIRILPGPSSLWLDGNGNRLPVPLFPGTDTRATLKYLRGTGHDHSWFILNQRIISKEFALSGSEQNPDLTAKSLRLLAQRLSKDATGPVDRFVQNGADFVTANSVPELVAKMNTLTDAAYLDADRVQTLVDARDAGLDNEFGKDAQWHLIRQARNFTGDKILRVAPPHRLQDPAAGPLIAVKLNILTRKTLGGLHTNLDGQVLNTAAQPIPGLFAAGEVSGFGGGGVHGFNSLEGTFLGGCLFSGRQAGRAAAS